MEHAQHLSSMAAAAALAEEQLWVVGNPLHIPPDAVSMEERLGSDRSRLAYAFRAMLKVRWHSWSLPNRLRS